MEQSLWQPKMPHPPLLKRNEPHEEDTADAASSLFHQPLFRPFPLEGAATTTIQMYSYAATAFAPLRENERSRRRGSDGTPRTQSEDAAWWEGNVNNEREAAGACSVETKDDCCVASMKRWVTGDGRGVCVCDHWGGVTGHWSLHRPSDSSVLVRFFQSSLSWRRSLLEWKRQRRNDR